MNEQKFKLLKRFLDLYPWYPHRMRSTLHSFDDTYLCSYHLEDDCWVHTMMVFSHADITGLFPEEETALLIAAITHDAGKIYTRKSHTPGKVNFWGHPEAGVQFTAEVCHALPPNSTRALELAVFAVAHHIAAYTVQENEIWVFFVMIPDIGGFLRDYWMQISKGKYT